MLHQGVIKEMEERQMLQKCISRVRIFKKVLLPALCRLHLLVSRDGHKTPTWGPILPTGCGTHNWRLHALCGYNFQVCVWFPPGGCVLVYSRHWLDHWSFLCHLWATGQWCHQCFGEMGPGTWTRSFWVTSSQRFLDWRRETYTGTYFLEKEQSWGVVYPTRKFLGLCNQSLS